MKSRVVFMGSRNLAYKALKWLLEDNRFIVVALVLAPCSQNSDLINLAERYKINIVDETKLQDITFDVGISVNYHRIIDKSVLDLAPLGFWNIHHSYNLRLRGRHITTHAILNSRQDQIYYHGTCIHLMVPQLDSGPIVASRSVAIEYNDTAYTLFTKVDDLALEIFKEWIPRIAFEKIYLYESTIEGIRIFKAKDLPQKEIPNNLSNDEIYDYVRAFDFPDYEPAFTYIDGVKTELVIIERENYKNPIMVGDNVFFTRSNE